MKKGKSSTFWWGVLPVVGFLGLWEAIARRGLISGHLLLPPFSVVIREFFDLTSSGLLLENFEASLLRIVIGFCAGSVTGILFGIIMGWKEILRRTFSPIIALLYPIPALGWLPLLMLWIGINEMLPIAIIFICSFFPVLYNTITGIRQVNKKVVDAARTLGASERYILFHVFLPLALPNIFTGLQLEAGMAWRVVIAAEMVAIPTGIGALMMKAESLIRVDIIIVCLMILSFMCLIFERLFIYLEAKLTSKWK
ncbi:MAG: ABC transporter permease [Deltaproteobacteria bacterium]|nr:ABC transporter permease [Deltaproteobacteria bacterium]